MSSRRDRPSQVRRRPPSDGRPRQLPPPPRQPVVPHTVGRRQSDQARGMPLPARLALLVAVAVLAVVVVSTVTGVLPGVVSAIGTALGGIAGKVLPSPVPSVSIAPAPDAPTLVAPERAATNKPTTALLGTVPLAVVGRAGFLVRVYVTLPEQDPVVVREIPVGATPSFVISDLPLEPGPNDVTATVVGPAGESKASAAVTFILDTVKPKVAISSPKNGATVNGETAKITGTTEGLSVLVARNQANGTSATATADAKGAFTVEIALGSGANAINLTATDPAGNDGTAAITLRRGSGQLDLALAASAYRISAAVLPRVVELTARVTNPDGRPLGGQTVTFSLSIPGVPAITGDDVTNSTGTATFRTTIPAGATVGSGLATAFVSTVDFGVATARISITITK